MRSPRRATRLCASPPARASGCCCCAWGCMATDAVTRLRPGPWLRVLFLAIFLGVAVMALGSGRVRPPLDHARVCGERRALRARAASARAAGGRLARGGGAGGPAAGGGVLSRTAHPRRHPRHAQRDPDDPGDRAVRHSHGPAGRTGRRGAAGGAAWHPRHRRGSCGGGAVSVFAAADRGQHRRRVEPGVAPGGGGGAWHGHDPMAGVDARSRCRWRCRSS